MNIYVPEEAKKNIIRTQGKNGKAFLDNLSKRFSKYTKKWKLNKCKFLAHSTNLIYSCKSDLYGDVVIKVGVPEDERLLTEISTLKFYNDKSHTCKLYEYSLDDGFILLERLFPGSTLKDTATNSHKRTEAFLSIYKHYHLPCDDTSVYPTYTSLIESFVVDFNLFPNFKKYYDIKKTFYYELSNNYSGKYLLHGDMHYRNILSHGNTFKIIDPHGIIGDPVFDISRFLSNELAESIKENRLFDHDIVLHISKSLDIPVSILYNLLVVDVTHHASYHLGNPITKDIYEYNMKRCETAYGLFLSVCN